MSIRILHIDNPQDQQRMRRLQQRLRAGELTAVGGGELDVPAIVRGIIADVQADGDRALIDYERRLDRAELTPAVLRVPSERIEQAHAQADKDFLGLVRRVAANIRQYQKAILAPQPAPVRRGGRQLGLRYLPLDRVGVYVPGGKALYPSTVLMTVVPAQVAGVPQIAIASPPSAGGDIDPMVLALAGELGVREVYRLGGAVAVAAMALGTASVPAVDKIVGPGNAFVAEAKRQLFGRVGIDSIAGPSEVLIIADQTARPDWLAADLLAQAEHNPGSAVLVTTSAELAAQVASAADEQAARLDRADAIRDALEENSCIIVVGDLAQAAAIANAFATEHLQIITADDEAVLAQVRHAGAIFLGAHTPVPLGDYYAGPSHVLPTGGTARFFSALSSNDFRKASSLIRYDAAALAEDGPDVIDFATREGLTAHANAVRVRGQAGAE